MRLSFDPGDMDTPFTRGGPDADRSLLKRPEAAARELADFVRGGADDARGRGAEDAGGEMIAAGGPDSGPRREAPLVDRGGRCTHWPRRISGGSFSPGTCVANDAATLPASLFGRHLPSGRRIEARLAGRDSLAPIG